MRLDPDCTRDVLLTIEDQVDLGCYLRFAPDAPAEIEALAQYPPNVVLYHVKQCQLAGFISRVTWFLDGGCIVFHLTPDGHEFLENIRANTNWEKTKQIAQNVGSFSIQTLTQIATGVITSLLNKNLGI